MPEEQTKQQEAVKSSQNLGIVQVQDVTRIYHVGRTEVAALRGISLEVKLGELAVLKGRSGSGKTTLLNLIGGLDRPTSGEITVYDQPLSQLSKNQLTDLRRHRIGFVFQSFALIPTFSALENVELMLRIAQISQDRQQRALRSLELVGLGPWANHRPWELSGGQQQRVSIARALVTRPDLILADEPTGELDSVTGRQIMALFRHIVIQEGITVLMATHDPAVEDYAHVVFELGDGQMEAVRRLDRPSADGQGS